ncbi:hypothetical protein A2U01_0046494, partial [Trifolium medium]|nr:hypothetical protein [Trifolium medium]
SVRHFKEMFYIVRPLMELVMDSLFESEFVTNEDGSVRLDEEGVEMTRLMLTASSPRVVLIVQEIQFSTRGEMRGWRNG